MMPTNCQNISRRAIAMLCLVILMTASAHARQTQERMIKKVSWPDEPVRITKIKVAGKPIGLRQKFTAHDDWLKQLSISLKNVSDKPIVFIDIAINFPRPDELQQDPEARDHILYGKYPLMAGQAAPDALMQEKPVKPGETVDIALTDYEGMRELLRQTKYLAGIKQIEIDISEVVFDDAMKWSGGVWLRRDSQNPDRWNRIETPTPRLLNRNIKQWEAVPQEFGLVILMTASAHARQTQERMIKKVSWPDEPVRITKIKVAGKPIGLRQKFTAHDDWLKQLSISLKNVSGKVITFISIRLDFPLPEGSKEAAPSTYDVYHGRHPSLPPDMVVPGIPDPIQPGATRDIILSGAEYGDLRRFLDKGNYPAGIKEVDLFIAKALFDDGTMWSGGTLLRQDPNNPQQWIPIDKLPPSSLIRPAKFFR